MKRWRTGLCRFRNRWISVLTLPGGRTVSDPAEIDEEIHALCEALIASEGHVHENEGPTHLLASFSAELPWNDASAFMARL